MPGLKIVEPKPRVVGTGSEALHERTVYRTLDNVPTHEADDDRFQKSFAQKDISAGEAISHEQAWVADAAGQNETDAETTADLKRIVALSQEKFALIEQWRGRVDHKNPEYLEAMRRLAAIISESVRLEMKSALSRKRLDS